MPVTRRSTAPVAATPAPTAATTHVGPEKPETGSLTTGAAAPWLAEARSRTTGFDVASVTAAQLATLRAGPPADQRLAAVIVDAKKTYAGLVKSGAKVVASAPAGNGGQPTLALIPPGFDAKKPARVHTTYHGWNASVTSGLTHPTGVLKNITERFARDRQTIYVLPECQSAPTKPAMPLGKTDWANVSDIAGTTLQALKAAGYPWLDLVERVVSVHSGGGRAIGYAMLRTPSGGGLVADRIEIADAAYSVDDGTLSCIDGLRAWAATANGKAAKCIAYYEGDGGNSQKPDAAFIKLFEGRYVHQKKGTHADTLRLTFDRTPQV